MTAARQLSEQAIMAVLELFAGAGHDKAQPPILQPAELFLDLTGEDIRRRLFLTHGTDGAELCLRPDFTIPVCRAHLESDAAAQAANYFYHGPVFRQRADGLGEIPQIGAESLGRDHRIETDADMLALAVRALDGFGLADFDIRIGDEALFAAVLSGTDLSAVWQRRLRDLFGETEKLRQAIDRMSGSADRLDDTRDVRLGFLSALEGANPEAAHAVVEDLLSIAGISAVGGRTPGEIADRFLEQAALANGSADHAEAASVLKAFLAISGPAPIAAAELKAFARGSDLDLAGPIADFDARLAALAAAGIAPERLSFSADFGRRLDYYSGFVFEIHARKPAGGQLVGGGRYDKLMNLLGAEHDVPATGFSIWLDRVATALGEPA